MICSPRSATAEFRFTVSSMSLSDFAISNIVLKALRPANTSPTMQSPLTDENPYPRAGIRPAEVSRAAFVTIADCRGHLFAVDFLAPNQLYTGAQDFLSANRSGILFW